MRYRPYLLIILLPALLLSGCWDRMELEDQSYIIKLGLDLAENGQLLVSAQVALPQVASPGVLGPVKPSSPTYSSSCYTTTTLAGTLTQAIHQLNAGTSRRLIFKHLRAVIVGESLARKGIEPVIMELYRTPDLRSTVMLAQAAGRAYAILEQCQNVVGEINAANIPEGFLLKQKHLHLSPPVRMHHFINRLAAPGDDPFLSLVALNPMVNADPQQLAPGDRSYRAGEMPRVGGFPIEFSGTAIFRGDKLAGFLTVDETQMLLALRGEMGKAYLSISDPDVPGQVVSMRFHQENLPQYRASFRGQRPHLQVRILFEGEVLAAPGGTDYIRPDARLRLQKAATTHAEKTTRELLQKLQEWGADPVGFGLLFRKKMPTWNAWEAYGWREHVYDLEVDLSMEMRVRRYGLYTGPDRVQGGR